MTIQEKLDMFSLSPNPDEWGDLDPEFISKYKQYLDLKNLSTDGTYETEVNQMDQELVQLFDELHAIDEIVQNNEESQAGITGTGTDNNNNSNSETKEEQNTETEEENEEETEEKETQVDKVHQNNEESQAEKEPEKEPFKPGSELLHYLDNAKKVYASDLRKFNIPRELWNENEFSFMIGAYKLEKKDPPSLLLNVWTVIKPE